MSNKCVKYGPEGTGYISTPSFAIPDTGILTVETWMKSKIKATDAQEIIGDANYSNTIGYFHSYRSNNHFVYQYSTGVTADAPFFTNFFQNLDNQ